jgi:hypothetical protein
MSIIHSARWVTASLYLHWRGLAAHFRFGIRVATRIRYEIIEPSIVHTPSRPFRGLKPFVDIKHLQVGLRGDGVAANAGHLGGFVRTVSVDLPAHIQPRLAEAAALTGVRPITYFWNCQGGSRPHDR